MKTIKYKKQDGYADEYEFFYKGEKIYDAYDAPYESTDGCAIVGMLKAMESKGVIKLKKITSDNK